VQNIEKPQKNRIYNHKFRNKTIWWKNNVKKILQMRMQMHWKKRVKEKESRKEKKPKNCAEWKGRE